MPEAFIRFYIGMVVMKLSNGSSLFFNVIFSDVVDICIRGYPHENLTFASALKKGADVKNTDFFVFGPKSCQFFQFRMTSLIF